ncbi:MAG: glycine zipper 2TM domain-containing protein [Burkholderiaceae bacterium]|nr:glycine zipper 2TM domain-containing protein [Burkholderiaceae bacterium]
MNPSTLPHPAAVHRHPLLRLATLGLAGGALAVLTACSNMSPSARDTVIGATAGAVVGGALTGTTTGAAVGAAAGGVIGNEVSKKKR